MLATKMQPRSNCHRVLMSGVLWVAIIACQSVRAEEVAKEPHPVIKPMRYDEDYSFLADPAKRTDFFDPFKYISLSAGGSYVSTGAVARFRYNYYAPDLFGIGKTKDLEAGILLERYLLSSDWHLNDNLRAFVEIGHHVATDKDFPAGANDRSHWDFSQAFADFSMKDGNIETRARLGRQYLTLGSSRLVALRDGPNVRQKFDGARVTVTSPGTGVSTDFIAVRDVVTVEESFRDGSKTGDKLWGVYNVVKNVGGIGTNADFYYLGLERQGAAYGQGIDNERRQSFGARIWGENNGWDWNFEAVGQTGSFGKSDIAAWTVASVTGHTLRSVSWTPRLFLSANVASGDGNPKDHTLGTFNPLFPKLPYFEEASFVAPQNFKNLQPGLQISPSTGVKLGVDWNFLWREDNRDAVYVRGLRPLAGTVRATGSFIADVATLSGEWRLDRNVTVEGGYSHFFAGDVITNSGGHDSDFAYTAITVAF